MRVGKMHMHLSHVADMSRDWQSAGMCAISDLKIFGYARHTRDVRLHILHRLCIDEGAESLGRVELFPKRDWDAGRACQDGVRAYIIVPHWLFKPMQADRLGLLAEPLAGGQILATVGINGDRNVRAERLADRFEAFEIDHRVGMADLQFDVTESLFLDSVPAAIKKSILWDREPADVGIVSFESLLCSTPEQLPEWQAGRFGPQIPQGNVD